MRSIPKVAMWPPLDDMIFRTLPVRLFGYGIAISEALRYRLNYPYQELCRLAAEMYIISRVINTLYMGVSPKEIVDVILFEIIASLWIPLFVTHTTCGWVADLMYDNNWIPLMFRRWLPVLAGFLIVPVFYNYVDPTVELILMDDGIKEIINRLKPPKKQ